MQSLSFDHYTIKVQNLDISSSFYTDVLGLREITNQTDKPYIRWYSIGSGELHIVEGSRDQITTNIGVHLALKLTDFDSFLAQLKEKGITPHNSKAVPNSITTRADGVRQVYIQDPDGYWIEVNDAEAFE